MSVSLLHTPEGVRDIYDGECARKLAVQQKISRVFRLYGYQDIETPTFEFFDIFNKERGSVGPNEMFKLLDRDNNTLVLRPDMTPAIARCVAKYFMEETMPLRLCYRERTFINNSSYQGRLKETTQTGAELIGSAGADADAEMIAMVIDALKSAGLREFQVELGQVEFFRGLAEEAGMDERTQESLREQIEKKNYFGVEEIVSGFHMPGRLRDIFLNLPELFGSFEMLGRMKGEVRNERSLRAIGRLERVQEILTHYGLSEYVSCDLGMLSKYQYYTGIIFKAYTYGTGEYIVTGGRYDKLLEQFGKDSSAVGFAIVVDQLMLALSRQKIDVPFTGTDTLLLYTKEQEGDAVRMASSLRSEGIRTALLRQEDGKDIGVYLAYGERMGVRRMIRMENGRAGQVYTVCGAENERDALTPENYNLTAAEETI